MSTLRGVTTRGAPGIEWVGTSCSAQDSPCREWSAPGVAVPRGNRDEQESTVLRTETLTPQSRGAAEPREL